jgi:hypothetical protein
MRPKPWLPSSQNTSKETPTLRQGALHLLQQQARPQQPCAHIQHTIELAMNPLYAHGSMGFHHGCLQLALLRLRTIKLQHRPQLVSIRCVARGISKTTSRQHVQPDSPRNTPPEPCTSNTAPSCTNCQTHHALSFCAVPSTVPGPCARQHTQQLLDRDKLPCQPNSSQLMVQAAQQLL